MILSALPLVCIIFTVVYGEDVYSRCLKSSFEILEDQVRELRLEMEAMKATETNYNTSLPGTTYVRWGKRSCPAASSTLVYKGYTAGKIRSADGSGTNILCLHETPLWGRYLDGKQAGRATIYGGEYEPDGGSGNQMMPGMNAVNDKNTPCSVCRMMKHRDVLMIPGTNVCEPGWTKEYDGYLMASKAGDKGASEYICVDGSADISPGGKNSNQFLLYPVEVRCGTLKCPPFVDGREMTCVVCSS